MGAGVMLRSLLALRSVDAGFDPRNVLTMRVPLPETRYTTPAQVDALSSTPRCSACARCPASRPRRRSTTCRRRAARCSRSSIEGQAELLPRDQPTVAVRKITPGYLQRDADSAAARPRRRRHRRRGDARQPSAAASCCGETSIRSDGASRCRFSRRPSSKQVIGIVGDVKQGELSEPPMRHRLRVHPRARLAGARDRRPDVGAADFARAGRRRRDPRDRSASSRSKSVRTMDDVLDETLTSQRFSALLLGLFARCRADAGIGRHLQRAVVHRPRPQPRDRDPDRARRADRRRACGWWLSKG